MGRRKGVTGPLRGYGARYGVSVRKRARDVIARRRAKHECPFCASKGTVRRVSVGIWSCGKCGKKWAGGAYTPLSGLATYLGKRIIEEA